MMPWPLPARLIRAAVWAPVLSCGLTVGAALGGPVAVGAAYPALASAAAPAQTAAPPRVTAGLPEAGTLTVTFALRDFLLNREAPNVLTLHTPWGAQRGTLSGAPHPDPERRAYYARLTPLRWPLSAPAGTRAGRYPARVEGQLFSCAVRGGTCSARTVSVPVTLSVRPDGRVQSVGVRLDDPVLRKGSLRLRP
ncbi:hypothetical protein M8445_07500 [Deinococcus aquaticus]|uniref:Uncharacterized protein n=1 Tax=Deinococcus aquaticus TaxID=328692 RepID=A0ABY7V4A1_9DEIO|nr:hypothetical protein [Deinococcus aquaticus]WDA60033.1 hypothetical protein M8445_07500 [Deinococcus aquaticus]